MVPKPLVPATRDRIAQRVCRTVVAAIPRTEQRLGSPAPDVQARRRGRPRPHPPARERPRGKTCRPSTTSRNRAELQCWNLVETNNRIILRSILVSLRSTKTLAFVDFMRTGSPIFFSIIRIRFQYPHPRVRAARHPATRRPRLLRNRQTAMTAGVFPAPPAARFPIEITGRGSRFASRTPER